MNSRGSMPAICPATMIDAVKRPLPFTPFESWRSAMIVRSSLPISVATWNMVGDLRMMLSRSSGSFIRSSSWLMTACVLARLPAVSRVMIRSPGTFQVNILRKTEILSTPELVRVSLIRTSPLSSIMPTQYVIWIFLSAGLLLHLLLLYRHIDFEHG